jgi:hypothetical protein
VLKSINVPLIECCLCLLVETVTRLWAGQPRSRVQLPVGARYSSLLASFRLALGPSHFIYWLLVAVSLEVNWQADNSLPPSAESQSDGAMPPLLIRLYGVVLI